MKKLLRRILALLYLRFNPGYVIRNREGHK